ncbi:MAG TPA: DnaJ domain-containing protein [Kofleriaceae bacterium]|nr:DnaJ domain-containing protein [Kofleriaceae bacterium]
MAGAVLSIKLRCASWQQLATIYKRDLSRGSMFLKATTQPAIGTLVRIDLELPSASVIELQGTIVKHVTDPQRGTGVDLKLDPLPTKSVWMIESALEAAGPKGRASTGNEANQPRERASTVTDGEEVTAAEAELIRALEAEAESLRKLNPFLVLGVGYETTDEDVRHAFGELTKRYHPDRFARYQSAKLRQVAAEIFILIRDAYRRLADPKAREQVVATLRRAPQRAQTEPRGSASSSVSPPQQRGVTRVAVPTKPPEKAVKPASPHDAPTNPSVRPAELAHTDLAQNELAVPIAKPVRGFDPTVPLPPQPAVPEKPKRAPTPPPEPVDTEAIEELIEVGKYDEALKEYKALFKKNPHDRGLRAGIELCEGLKALAARDRLEAAQYFEAALELDPSNERAARELAEMRRQATNERKGLLSRLMGKKEPPP